MVFDTPSKQVHRLSFADYTMLEISIGNYIEAISNSSENKMTSEFIFIFGGVPQAHEVCFVTTYNEKALNPVQIGLSGFSTSYHYTKNGMASETEVPFYA